MLKMRKKLFLIGLGIKKEHLTSEILKKVKESEVVLFEKYTSFFEDEEWLLKTLKELNSNLIIGDRELIEQNFSDYLKKFEKISVLVIGDPLTATTHTSLILEAKEKGFEVEVINNVSVFNLITRTGLSVYKFGKTISLPFLIRDKRINLETPVRVIKENLSINAHTLLLMDLNPLNEDYLRMEEALEYLLEKGIKENLIICSRLGWKDEKIYLLENLSLEKIEEVKKLNLRPPLCVIVYDKNLNEGEKAFLSILERI
jgi:diphthine synthase